ncbi:hypothetical protein Sipo8835_32355 [Streptomyces ipomoeae]|uniref:Uncharacterized protein n=1 Tax=Streptomyces ipomoeae TaxID=103232 RepID=A0AAE9AXH8_9ACTN|nr:hypothetical protein [Streptomyces ipomoeae]MDX2697742.1 hypothetical protein [Streptomyces ipomoeae]MDX2825228.1 hypothetical protein [Streptomyces ipomoeae]MDX2843594.1 hypothetical protein [Streptomyces ipomoeae]MDX2876631.1 hypothetical protein [Streptomyces ipomoeae]TQE25015.1 hypothetical protein Sipo8835_32355 [Streptomyces ipomoeae]
MRPEPLMPYARLPRAYRDLKFLHSTVDTFGRAHWLLREPLGPRGSVEPPGPYDAVVVTVADGRSHETHLSSVLPDHHVIASLPDGGFVLAAARRGRTGDDQVQVFDALGRPSWTFSVGDGIEHLLTDEAGDLWVGYFDEGIFGDPLSAPGVRRWSSTGEPLWAYTPPPGTDWIAECYALNVDRRAAWMYPYTRFPLVEVRGDGPPRARTTTVTGASGVAVHGERVAFFGGYRDDRNRLVLASLAETSVETTATTRLTRPDGAPLDPRRRVVSRGPRLYVREKPYTEWYVLDISERGRWF